MRKSLTGLIDLLFMSALARNKTVQKAPSALTRVKTALKPPLYSLGFYLIVRCIKYLEAPFTYFPQLTDGAKTLVYK